MILALVAAVLALSPRAARAVDVFVQAENRTSSYNIMPDAITDNGLFLMGLDYEGEWAEFLVPAAPFGIYTVTMRCWGELNVRYTFHLATRPVLGEDPQTFILSYIGRGSCGS